jgi:hypothetical protein
MMGVDGKEGIWQRNPPATNTTLSPRTNMAPLTQDQTLPYPMTTKYQNVKEMTSTMHATES